MRNKKSPGFTLIELLVIISIISFLASIILVSLDNARKRGRDAKRMGDMRQLDTAIQEYILDNGHAPYLGSANCAGNRPDGSCIATDAGNLYWTELGQDLAPYLKKMPSDPCGVKCGKFSTWFAYEYKAPAEMADWCNNTSCGVSVTKLNEMYNLYAERLETTKSHWGFKRGFADSY